MRILWLHQYFATPAGWGSVRTFEFGRRFVAAGHAVDVLCCAAYDPSLAGRGMVEAGGMRVHVSRTRYRPQMGFLARVASFLSFACFALWHVLRHGRKYDRIIASSSPLTMAIPALVARWLYRKPFVFEVIDVWPDAAIAAGVLRNPLLQWLAFRLETYAYRHASCIVTCSPGMTERVLRKGEDRATGWRSYNSRAGAALWERHPVARGAKVVTIPNSCDLDVFRPDPACRAATRAALGVRDDQLVVLYTGAMGRSNAVDDMVQAAEVLAGDPRIVWWFAGDGAEADKLRQVAAEFSGGSGGPGAPRTGSHAEVCVSDSCPPAERPGHRCGLLATRFFGSLPREKVVELCQAADVALVTFMHAPLFEENSPNKFFDAISAGLPVIFNRSTWLEPDIAEYGCGVVCKGAEPAGEMGARLRELADNPSLRLRMAAGARRLAGERYSRDKLAETYLEVLNR